MGAYLAFGMAGDDATSSNTPFDRRVEQGERRRRTQSRPLRWQRIDRWLLLGVLLAETSICSGAVVVKELPKYC